MVMCGSTGAEVLVGTATAGLAIERNVAMLPTVGWFGLPMVAVAITMGSFRRMAFVGTQARIQMLLRSTG